MTSESKALIIEKWGRNRNNKFNDQDKSRDKSKEGQNLEMALSTFIVARRDI